MHQRLIDLHHEYVHDHCDRRRCPEQAARLVGGASAAAPLPILDCNFAHAETIKADDPPIAIERVTFIGATGTVNGYFAKPSGDARHPGIVVIHEIGGITAHIEDIARRLAVEGYAGIAFDFLSPLGGTPAGGRDAAQLTMTLDPKQMVANAVAAVGYLRSRAEVSGKVGDVGVCRGGRVAQSLTINEPQLDRRRRQWRAAGSLRSEKSARAPVGEFRRCQARHP
jgi:carboxymethylenebutenolidase